MATLPQASEDTQTMAAISSLPPLLALPAELRNKIYGYLLIYDTPIRIRYRQHSEEEHRRVQFQRDQDSENPAKFFISCKAINREAPSIYYSNNTFVFVRDADAQIRDRALAEIPVLFFGIVGSHASWIRKITLDMEGLTEEDGFRDLGNYWLERWISRKPRMLEVMPLLRAIWDLKLNVDVRIIGCSRQLSSSQSCEEMTRVIRSLLSGELGLRQYGPQVTRVAVRYDGGGGAINWAEAGYYRRGPKLQLRPSRDCADFTAMNDGQQLYLMNPKHERNLLDLPGNLLPKIGYLVMGKENMVLDLDQDTSLAQGFAHVTRQLYRQWRDRFFHNQKYTLLMSTREPRSTFSNFTKLRPLLRKTFLLLDQFRPPVPQCRISGTDVTIKLDFRLDSATELTEVRFNCLPFVMETSGILGRHGFFVRSWAPGSDNGQEVMVREHRITFQDLRARVVKALIDVVFLSNHRREPEIWIDGFGEIVEVTTKPYQEYPSDVMPDTATKLTLSGRMKDGFEYDYYTVSELHYRDCWYRDSGDRSMCGFADIDQFFPFTRSPTEALRYLIWVLKDRGPFIENDTCWWLHPNRNSDG